MKVILICVITIDGKIARGPLDPINWTSRQDKKFFMEETKKVGVVIVGHNTYKAFGKTFEDRLLIVLTSCPEKEKSIPGVLEFTNKQPKQILTDLGKRGFKAAVVAGGGKVNALFLKNGLIDELWLTVEPKIFGMGINLFEGENFDIEATLLSIKKMNEISLVKYKI